MEITLGKGLDNIVFGKSKEDIIDMLGWPDKSYETDMGSTRLQFNDLKIELSFEPENSNKFGWLEIHNSNAKLFGKNLIGCQLKDVLAFIDSKLNEQPQIEDYGSFISYAYNTQWLELQFQFNVLTNILIGVLYGDNDEPIWPAT